ncbi:MAG: GerAB/ArcD/ProY family transporter, partial [Clostridia bacterium]|nr:GerAB/ArcD/ProY family transporter [Clostridia bacterium]
MRPVKKLGKDAITATQLAILSFTGLFSPLIWLLPHTASHIAGSASVFSPLIAILPLGVLAFVIFSLIKNRRSGEGLADIIIRCTGNTAGRIICFLYLLWFIFYAAVSLRSSSERFLSTIFPGGSLWVFMPITLLLAVIGALGKVRSLAGAAQIFFRVIVLALLGIFLFTLPSVSRYNLLPYTYKDIPAAALGGLAVANAISPAIYILFLLTKVEKEKLSKKTPLLLTFLMLLISLLMFITIIGNFGEQFTATMQNPFFTMIRNISIFDVVERVEAVVVAMWVLTDFIFL